MENAHFHLLLQRCWRNITPTAGFSALGGFERDWFRIHTRRNEHSSEIGPIRLRPWKHKQADHKITTRRQ
ncbi:uncharacterized protein YALI1_D29081g [Yarrowia lipolytica]|uniref:Uncharacterized protein n=1 Tax=Yarrowia lipolytica TaxID=4952 RepID=A0A1D8NFU0_YARLL|nr:hypothetical protein YALI1_D29081g [Yarrowia lipolytica]